MEKTFQFNVNSPTGLKLIALLMPTQAGGVVTNKFCPNTFLTGDGLLAFAVTAINGESEQEFVADCQNQVAIISQQNGFGLLNVHISALDSIVAQHVRRCGRLVFNDLLIYVDIFAHLLQYTGISIDTVRKEYVKAVYNIITKYGSNVKNPINLAPLSQTPLYDCLVNEYNRMNNR